MAGQAFQTRETRRRGRPPKKPVIWLDPDKTGHDAWKLETRLRQKIVGQDDAVQAITHAYQIHRTGLREPGRPISNFLFLGPTGSGKTRIVEATAESLLENPRAVIKIDCAEFQHRHEIAKLVGSPPGYLGHRETHPLLSQEVLNQYHTENIKISFVLFDEIEKASDVIWNLLLGILDKATLTLGNNRKVDFSRAMIFMTSNLGAGEMGVALRPKFGFQSCDPMGFEEQAKILTSGKVGSIGINAARRKFTPEFMNRLDRIVAFRTLGEEQLKKILDIELEMVQQRIFNTSADRAFVFTVSNETKKYLLANGSSAEYGARHLKRAIEKLLVQPISNLLATDQIRGGDWVKADYNPESKSLQFTREAEGLPVWDMGRLTAPGLILPNVPFSHGQRAASPAPRR